MAKVDVLNWEKKKTGDVELPADVFEQPVKKDLLHRVVNWQLAKRRQGTHQTKTRAFVSGGGRKPFKQKGTGNARQGTTRSPLMPGGAIVFGPQPRDYSYTLPRKVRQAGLRSALSYLLSEGKLYVIDDMKSEDGKTKTVASNLKKLGLEKTVLIDKEENKEFKRASRNLPKVRYYAAEGLNVYDLLKYDAAVLTKSSIEAVVAKCGRGQ